MFFEKMRSYTQTWVFKILLGAICLSFVIFGFSELIMRVIHDRPLAKVGSKVITSEEYAHLIQQETNRLHELSKFKLDPAAIKQLGLHQKALDKLIDEKALHEYFYYLKLSATPNMIKQMIQSIPAFQRNGLYDADLLRDMLRSRRMSEATFAQEIKNIIFTQQLANPFASTSSLPKIYIDIILDELTDKSEFKAVHVDLNHIQLADSIQESELKLYYDQHQEKYRAPEYRTVQYVVFDENEDSKNIAVTDEEINERYMQMQHEFSDIEKRFVERITCKTNDAIESVKKLIVKGVSFKDISKQLSEITYEDLGLVEKDMLSPEAETEVFKTKEGNATAVIPNGATSNIYFIKKIDPATVQPLAQVKDKVIVSLQKEKYNENLQANRNLFEDALASGMNLAEVAKAYKHHIINTQPFARDGVKEDGKKVFDSKLPEEVQNTILDQAFLQTDGSECQIIDSASGYAVAVKLMTVQPSIIPPLELIKEKVMSDYQNDLKHKKVLSLINKMEKDVNDVSSFEKRIHEEKLGKIETHAFSRLDFEDKKFEESKAGKFISKLPRGLLSNLFKTPVGTIVKGTQDSKDITIIFHAKSEPQKVDAKMRENIHKNIDSIAAKDILPFITTLAKNEIEIMVNQEVLENLTRAMNNGD